MASELTAQLTKRQDLGPQRGQLPQCLVCSREQAKARREIARYYYLLQ